MLRVLTWNMNGLRKNRHNLEEICKIHEPDVISIQESRLQTKSTKHITKFNLRGYDMKTTTNYGHRYELVTFFKKNTSITPINIGITHKHPIATYKICIKNSTIEHTITNIYAQHDKKLDTEALDDILSSCPNNILTGDFNNSLNNCHYRNSDMINLGLFNTNTSNLKTNFSDQSGTTIDHILVDKFLAHTHLETITLDGFEATTHDVHYHVPLLASFQIPTTKENAPRRNSRKMDQKEYQDALKKVMTLDENKKTNIKNTTDLDMEVKTINHIINGALDICNPKTIPKNMAKKGGTSDAIKLLIKLKTWARKQYNKNRNMHLGEPYIALRQLLDKTLQKQHKLEDKKSYGEG